MQIGLCSYIRMTEPTLSEFRAICFAAFDGPLPAPLTALMPHGDPRRALAERLQAEARSLGERCAGLRLAVCRHRQRVADPTGCPSLARMTAGLASARGRAIDLFAAATNLSSIDGAVSTNGIEQSNRRFVKGIAGDREPA